jgi:hypothetical protein
VTRAGATLCKSLEVVTRAVTLIRRLSPGTRAGAVDTRRGAGTSVGGYGWDSEWCGAEAGTGARGLGAWHGAGTHDRTPIMTSTAWYGARTGTGAHHGGPRA